MKDKFEIFNDIKIDTEKYEEIYFSNNDEFKKSMKTKIKNDKKQIKQVIAVASLAVVLGSGILVNDKVWANIEEIWYSLSDTINMKKDQVDNYKYDVNKVAEDKNIKILFNSIMVDDDKLIMDLDVDYSKFDPFKDFTKKQQKDWNIDKWGGGETELSVGGINEVYVDGVKLTGTEWGIGDHKEIDEKVVDVVMEQGMDAIESDKNNIGNIDKVNKDRFPYVIDKDKVYNFKINIKKLHLIQKPKSNRAISYAGVIRGNWGINMDIKGEDLINSSKTYAINKTIEFPQQGKDAKLELEEIKISPLYIKMNYKYFGMNSISTENIEFKVKNENNEEVILSMTNLNRTTGKVIAECRNILSNTSVLNITPYITDDKGNIKEILEDKTIQVNIDK